MHISATAAITARYVPPAKRNGPIRRPSSLNPSRIQVARTAYSGKSPVQSSTATRTDTHLANLNRLLQRESVAESLLPPSYPDGNRSGDCESGSSRAFVDGHDLSSRLPERTAEAMSPRSLNLIQRLVSGAPRSSPSRMIGRRWRDLHGANDWSGLLDPLDEDLRQEIVRYGEFVQAAYHAFHADPERLPADPRYVALPDRSYRVTCSLYVNSSIEAPEWVDILAPWMRQRSSWIGFVAVCDCQREINRLGRRDIVIALRGTATALEWAENFRATLVEIPQDKENSQEAEQLPEPKVGWGFWSLYRTGSKRIPSLRDAVLEEVRRLMKLYKGEQLSITVAGHSLGAALAVLVADELRGWSAAMPPVAVFSFGGPHVGNLGFAERVRARGAKVLRVVNERDLVTKVPGVFAGHSKPAEEDGSATSRRRPDSRPAAARGMRSAVPDKWRVAVDHALTAWSYSHVGRELRVDSRESPFLRPDADLCCCHDLEAYLHLVDGFLSSRCPFRSDATRSIAKLVVQQGPNLKRIYTSKVLAALRPEPAAMDAAMEKGPQPPEAYSRRLASPPSRVSGVN